LSLNSSIGKGGRSREIALTQAEFASFALDGWIIWRCPYSKSCKTACWHRTWS